MLGAGRESQENLGNLQPVPLTSIDQDLPHNDFENIPA